MSFFACLVFAPVKGIAAKFDGGAQPGERCGTNTYVQLGKFLPASAILTSHIILSSLVFFPAMRIMQLFYG